jgi:hypothetical protein
MEPHVRAHIHFNTTSEAADFVKELNSDGTTNKYTLENFNGTSRVNARSLLGVIYAMTEHDDNIFIVNNTIDGYFPSFVDKYRI